MVSGDHTVSDAPIAIKSLSVTICRFLVKIGYITNFKANSCLSASIATTQKTGFATIIRSDIIASSKQLITVHVYKVPSVHLNYAAKAANSKKTAVITKAMWMPEPD